MVRFGDGERGHGLPEGYHTLAPYLIVKGAARALDFYSS